jgi:tetratricopeptide (TPR) repeat protein
MPYTLLHLILWVLNYGSSEKVSLRNKAKLQAELAYQQQDFQLAASYYRQILNSTLFAEAATTLNLGHAYFRLGDYANAKRYYQKIVAAQNPDIASDAYLQLGWIASHQQDYKTALAQLRNALTANPDNEEARYNYELLKKKFPVSTPPPPPTTAPPQTPPPAQQPTVAQKAEMDDQQEKKDILNKLQNFDLNKDQAQLILDGLKNREVQFIQQHRRGGKSADDIKQKW